MMRVGLLAKGTLYRQALAEMLNRYARYDVIAHEASAGELVAALGRTPMDALVIDADGLAPGELDMIRSARGTGNFALIIIAPTDGRLAEDGGEHTLPRSVTAAGLLEALEDASGASSSDSVRETRVAYAVDNSLTRREQEIARLVAQGLSNRRISGISGLREQSVKNLVSVIMRKMGCENRVQVALKLINAPKAA